MFDNNQKNKMQFIEGQQSINDDILYDNLNEG